ncbi:hypothetical protein LTR36_005137 [Oleoguttula mirabilis]|uniref:Voltage-gated hydrogen channel 1 n=1 Tax=Oleoguttula mirabilis TaxID=1507867 RepID=A0AAV9JWX5_9PEZI|nr:hypothetical protein LTR36_005137 [Oleoguttula mirabilis]
MTNEQHPLLPSDRLAQAEHFTAHTAASARRQTKRYLTSKTGHYSVLALVSVDISAIFADLILQLLTCEGRIPLKDGEKASDVLGILSLVFSCLFMVELLASLWSFGPAYFKSKFHCLDATVILAGFILDVVLKGMLEEIGSIVVVLRLWRVFKIIEELSAGAEEQMEPLQEQIEDLEKENHGLREQVTQLRMLQSQMA